MKFRKDRCNYKNSDENQRNALEIKYFLWNYIKKNIYIYIYIKLNEIIWTLRNYMKFNENRWNPMKVNEIQWKSMKSDENRCIVLSSACNPANMQSSDNRVSEGQSPPTVHRWSASRRGFLGNKFLLGPSKQRHFKLNNTPILQTCNPQITECRRGRRQRR